MNKPFLHQAHFPKQIKHSVTSTWFFTCAPCLPFNFKKSHSTYFSAHGALNFTVEALFRINSQFSFLLFVALYTFLYLHTARAMKSFRFFSIIFLPLFMILNVLLRLQRAIKFKEEDLLLKWTFFWRKEGIKIFEYSENWRDLIISYLDEWLIGIL